MTTIIKQAYQGQMHSFNADGWFNATEAARRFGKRPVDWLRLDETRDYIAAMAQALEGSSKVSQNHFGLVRATRGGVSPGTWMHPKLAVPFARWLNLSFAVWCDLQIDTIIRNSIRAEGAANLLPLLLRDGVATWELRFKPSYYEALAGITGTTYTGHSNGTPALYGAITDKWVYACLLPDEVHAELKLRRNGSQKMHQWLTHGGQEQLDKQIDLVQSIASTSTDARDFEARMMQLTKKRGQMSFVYPTRARGGMRSH